MKDSATLPVYIIGNTPLAYALAAKLTLAQEKTYLLAGSENKLFSSPILLREDNLLQKQRINIETTSLMLQPAKLVIMDIKPDNIKSYLTYFSRSKTLDCPIISLCKIHDNNFINNITHKQTIPAYFNGQISLIAENTLISHNSRAEITISTNDRHPFFNKIQSIFAKTYFKISFNPNEQQNFWNHFIPYAACSLFSLQKGKHIKDITKIPDLRQFINNLIDELISITPTEIIIDKEQILTDIYSISGNYKFPIVDDIKKHQFGELAFISQTLSFQSNNNMSSLPLCKMIIYDNLKKTLPPVE